MTKKLSLLALCLLAISSSGLALAEHSTQHHNNTQVQHETKAEAKTDDKAPDVVILSRLKAKFIADDRLNDTKINVDVSNGIVTLKGVVNTQQEAEAAKQIASQDPDVKGVESQLTIAQTAKPEDDVVDRGQERADNTGTSAKVRAKLIADDMLNDTNIKVTSLNDAIVLEGTVKSRAQAQRATRLAREVQGVKRVVNKMTVKGS